MNTKLTGIYLQYQIKDEALFNKLIKSVISQAIEMSIFPIQNFMIFLKEQKSSSTINDGLTCFLSGPKDERTQFVPVFDHLDLKRDYLMNNFFYVSLRLAFEGFQEDLEIF